MLTTCPECSLPVSDKAFSCPHCGYPMKPDAPRKYNSKKRMRLPNGFGQISEIKNRNLRKPFRAMVTTGFDPETGRPICKLLKPEAYFETYNQAYAALLEYNKNPYDMSESLTMQELFDRWIEVKSKTISDSGQRMYSAAWKYCSSVHKIQVKALKISDIKFCMEEGSVIKKGVRCKATPVIKKSIKILFNLLLDYAVENSLVDKNISRVYVVHEKSPEQKHHIPYTDEEMNILWNNLGQYGVDLILIQCYTGLRPQEIGLIEVETYKDGTIKGGMKTEAGKNRVIPIHSKIQPLVEKRYEESVRLGSKYLFNHTQSKDGRKLRDTFLSYERYKDMVLGIYSKLGLSTEHKPHDGRAQFATMAKKYQVDDYAIKRIMGHSIKDLTERVYTTRDVEWLRSEIEKIK